jgi:hypothetical protein
MTPPALYDNWEMDEQLRHIERVLVANRLRVGKSPAPVESEPARHDVPHAGPPAWHMAAASRSARQPAESRSLRRGWALGLLIWTAVLFGTTALVCGGALLVWAFVTAQHALWTLGMPIALGGQIVLLFGLLLQLNRLWRESRQAVSKLDKVGAQLRELKTAATLQGTTQGPSAASFYAHLANGASPQILLSDLKSQLDLLAMKLGREE